MDLVNVVPLYDPPTHFLGPFLLPKLTVILITLSLIERGTESVIYDTQIQTGYSKVLIGDEARMLSSKLTQEVNVHKVCN